MPPVHDTQVTIGSIAAEVQNNLYDLKLRYFSSTDILNAIQEAYNKMVALMAPIEQSTFIPMISQPYYNLSQQIPDFMYLIGIFNPSTNLWLEGLSYKQMKATYQTYLAIGQPKWLHMADLRRAIIWPYPPGATGVLYVLYKASAPPITPDYIPVLPYSVGSLILEYLATSDLLTQQREFKKSQIWAAKVFASNPQYNNKSIWDHCKTEIQGIARNDRENVLEPYRWIFHGGQLSVANWINNETPAGTIDGTNSSFTLAQVPNPTASLLFMKNGSVMFNGPDYSLNGQTISLQTGALPQVGDVLRAWYQVA